MFGAFSPIISSVPDNDPSELDMEYEKTPISSNVEDRRGQRGGAAMGAGGLGIGAIIVIFAISYFTGISPQVLMGGAEMVGVGGSHNQAPPQSGPAADPNDPMRIFVAHVLGGTEDVWAQVLSAQKGVCATPPRHSFSTTARRDRDAGARDRRWARSTARSTRRSIWIRHSSAT